MSDEETPGFSDGKLDETLPDVVKNFLRSGANLEEVRLDERGKWTHEGLDFENQRIIDLFSRSVGRTDGGTWVLEVGRFTYPIAVEDCGFFVERIDLSQDPPMLKLSDKTTETLDPDTLDYQGDGKLYCRVKGGEFRARFKWDAYNQIGDRLEERDGEIVMPWDGGEVSLGSLADIEARES